MKLSQKRSSEAYQKWIFQPLHNEVKSVLDIKESYSMVRVGFPKEQMRTLQCGNSFARSVKLLAKTMVGAWLRRLAVGEPRASRTSPSSRSSPRICPAAVFQVSTWSDEKTSPRPPAHLLCCSIARCHQLLPIMFCLLQNLRHHCSGQISYETGLLVRVQIAGWSTYVCLKLYKRVEFPWKGIKEKPKRRLY